MRSGRSVGIGMAVLLAAVAGAFCWTAFQRNRHPAEDISRMEPVTPAVGVSETARPLTSESRRPVNPVAPQDVVHQPGVSPPSRTSPALHLAFPIPPSVREIVARTTDPGTPSRLSAVHALGDQLSAQERAALYSFVLDPNRTDDLTPDQEYVSVNEIMKKLRQQLDHAPDFGAVLVAVYRDRKQDSVVRDYAIQHFGEWCLVNDFDAQFEMIFREALSETDSSIAGTALIALDKLAARSSKVSPLVVESAALVLASDESANKGSRAAAIAICGTRGITNVLQIARKSARETSIPLCLASIAYVGGYGQPEDEIWLTEIVSEAPRIVATSAKIAIEKIALRNGHRSDSTQRKGEL
jgi:hypothetical protein